MADDKRTPSGTDADRRRWALLVSSLVTAADQDLEAFRRRRGVEPTLDPEQLRLAREVIGWLGEALGDAAPERWQTLARAAHVLGIEGSGATPPVESKPKHLDRADEAGAGSTPQDIVPEPTKPAPVGTADPGAAPPIAPVTAPSPWLKPAPGVTGVPEPRALASATAPARPAAPPPPTPRPPVVRPVATTPAPPLAVPSVATAAADGDAIASLLAKNPRLAAFVEAAESSKSDGGGTVVVSGVRPSNPALPFQPREAESAPKSSKVETLPPPSADAPPSGTGSDAPSFLRVAPPPSWGQSRPRAMSEQTLAFQALGAEGEVATPAAPVLPAHLAAITLERYAALEAQRRLWPEWRATIEQNFGLASPNDRDTLDAHWKRALAGDPELCRAFEWQRDQHEQWERNRSR